MPLFNYHGSDIFYKEYGEGDPLLLLHGNTVSGRMFDDAIPYLNRNYHVIIMDFLGCGRSDRLDEWPSDLWYAWAQQATALINHLHLYDVNIIGCSGGALVALNIALEYPVLVHCVAADSFEGLQADPNLTEQICRGRELAKEN